MNKLSFIKKYYVNNGLKIFPVMENKKLPLIDAWQKDCSSDFMQIVYWLENAKNCNIGLPANENDLFIIDIDMHGEVNGLDNFHRLLSDIGVSPSEIDTLQQTTPSGGIHLIFKSDDELKQVLNSSNCFKDYKGIDIRTRGYILVQPSIINGTPYELNMKDINSMPIKLKEFIVNNNEVEVEERKDYTKPTNVSRGGRDTSLFDYISYLYYNTKLDYNEIRLLAHNFNRTICEPSLSDSVVEYKVNRMFKKKRPKFIIIKMSEEDDVHEEKYD